MSEFYFDQTVVDFGRRIKIDVTRCDEDDEDVQINILPSAYNGMRICLFLSAEAAESLAHTLLAAVNAQMYINPHKALDYGKP